MKRIYKNEIISSCVVYFFVFSNILLQNELNYMYYHSPSQQIEH